MTYITVPLETGHNRSAFSCGKEILDQYIQKQARQDMKRHLAVVFVLPDESGRIKGYYTLSNDSISRDIVPPGIQKKMPQAYRNLPVSLLGRLAVDNEFQKQGLGEQLLLDALHRCADIAETEIGSMAVVVDPLDKEAILFYEQYGFIFLPTRGRMFIPMKTIKQLF
ncbi:Acetyltransferase (GNAT) domain-containing protein [Nitrosomonas sp. Nm51]|uniref:GNAT family N-acetyltransferase n=1 Tax=Nitrosomonas sp. Nm51 TaxID=133720 RepID=UPI0008C7F34B|nr:GNAT family N-acetyltransferase [Nitrosomonas sp. Nm51]SER44123.1 Acetyltransferase (GNAT) domain-containing protein [Nitrosomonas sp. Nm51]